MTDQPTTPGSRGHRDIYPASYDDTGGPEEQRWRADFATAVRLRESSRYAEDDRRFSEFVARADEIDESHLNNPEHDRHYSYLADVFADWQRAPDTMQRFLEHGISDDRQGINVIDATGLRSHHQARELHNDLASEAQRGQRPLTDAELDTALAGPTPWEPIAEPDGSAASLLSAAGLDDTFSAGAATDATEAHADAAAPTSIPEVGL
ncbi:hypothetical protein C5E45_23885 [Nocardia nova]|uniref:Uncharacterized protein n=1 Tax=Nocardia nova TaxID=37330 RepID=A0A2S6AKU4_9NOCA|nr:hypothetical protein [Nocardia nova]PPJ35847.1 hypothetical protein C5E45_23885 [Nocardia nova]